MPAHNHGVQCTADDAETVNAASALPATSAGLGGAYPIYGRETNLQAMSPNMITDTGGGQPHANMQPFLVVNFIIALQGQYPSRG